MTRSLKALPTRFTPSFATQATEFRKPPRTAPGAGAPEVPSRTFRELEIESASFADARERPNQLWFDMATRLRFTSRFRSVFREETSGYVTQDHVACRAALCVPSRGGKGQGGVANLEIKRIDTIFHRKTFCRPPDLGTRQTSARARLVPASGPGSMVSTDWDRFAADEAARVAVEDELLSAQSDSALGLNRVGTPNGAAEHEEIQKRNALRDAKESWRAREDVAVAQKHFVSDEIGVVRVIASEEVARPRSTSGDAAVPGTHEETPSSSQTPTNAIHVKNCKDCRFTLPPSLKTAKLFVENCVNVTLDVNCMVITQHLEIWGSTGCKLVFTKPVATVQVDSCTDCEIILKNGLEDLGAVVHATCGGFLNLVWSDTTGDESSNESSVDLVLSEKKVTPDEAAKQISKRGVHETPQFITRLINNKPLTEHVVRDKDEYPTTHRELLLDREEAAKGGDTHAQTLIKNNVPIELDTSNERAGTYWPFPNPDTFYGP